MSARIEIGEFVLKADDGGGWVVGRPRQRLDKGREKTVETIDDPGYYGRLEHALTALGDRLVWDSDAESLEDVAKIIEALRHEVSDAFEIRPPPDVDPRPRPSAPEIPSTRVESTTTRGRPHSPDKGDSLGSSANA